MATCDVGITENDLAAAINIAPNPFSSTLHIQSKSSLQQVSMIMYNSYGIPVKQLNKVSGNNFTINSTGLVNGIYYLQITENGKVIKSEKVVVQ